MTKQPTVKEFKYIPGENDWEYIKLLEEHLEIERKITSKAITRIKELSKKQKETDWIPYSKRPPEKEGTYFITTDNNGERDVGEDFFYFRGDGTPSWYLPDNVVAWMPLPQPYRNNKNPLDEIKPKEIPTMMRNYKYHKKGDK